VIEVSRPYFSVIIPTYNRAHIICECIDSVLAQTFSDFEVIIVDNGSTDNTGLVVSEYADERIRYIYQEGSGSPAGPRNRGIDESVGSWISFLDSDDQWFPHKLKKVHEAIRANPNNEVFCHHQLAFNWDNRKGHIIYYGPTDNDMYKTMLLYGTRLVPSATSVNAEFITKNNLRFNESADYLLVEDYDLWLRLAHNGARFCFIEDVLGKYTLSNDNMSSNRELSCKNVGILYEFHANHVQEFESDKSKIARQLHARKLSCLARNAILSRKFLSFAIHILLAFMASPKIMVNTVLIKSALRAGRKRYSISKYV